MSAKKYNEKMLEFVGVQPPPDFGRLAKYFDEQFLSQPFGVWFDIPNTQYVGCRLYLLAGWEQEYEIEYDDYKTKYRKICKLTATN